LWQIDGARRHGTSRVPHSEAPPMKPAPFSYLRPQSAEEALMLLGEYRDDARVLAGGQSLVPVLNFRMSRFKYLVDINRIQELSYIRLDRSTLRIGATTRYREIERSELVRIHAPLLAAATKFVAHLPVRTRGTIGGSLAHSDPAAEYPAVVTALGGTIVVRSRHGEREIAADDFFLGLFATDLSPNELIVEVRLPMARPGQVFGFQEISRRPGDLAIVGIAAALELKERRIETSRLAVLGLGTGVQRLLKAEAVLNGQEPRSDLIERAAREAADIEAQSDLHATADLRRHFVSVLLRRAVQQALESRRPAS
jgi:CO/xanthine dehydrogenase FAD-binding subunit